MKSIKQMFSPTQEEVMQKIKELVDMPDPKMQKTVLFRIPLLSTSFQPLPARHLILYRKTDRHPLLYRKTDTQNDGNARPCSCILPRGT